MGTSLTKKKYKSSFNLLVFFISIIGAANITAQNLQQITHLRGTRNINGIIVNVTSVGLHPHINESPLRREYITANHVVFDAVYSPVETQLLKDAKEKGATVVHGLDMLLYQGAEQFKLYTGQDAPIDLMRNILYEK